VPLSALLVLSLEGLLAPGYLQKERQSIAIAKTVQGNEYVVLIDNKVVAGPFATAAEAVKARDALLASGTAS